jgi:hypothetical protein
MIVPIPALATGLAALFVLVATLAESRAQPAGGDTQHILQVRNAACGPITITTSNPTLCKRAPCTTPTLTEARFINLPLNLNAGEASVELQIAGSCDGGGVIKGQCAITLGQILPGYDGSQSNLPYLPNRSDGMNQDYGTGAIEQQGARGSGVEGEPDPSLDFMHRIPSRPKSNNLNVSVRVTSCDRDSATGPRVCKVVCGGL